MLAICLNSLNFCQKYEILTSMLNVPCLRFWMAKNQGLFPHYSRGVAVKSQNDNRIKVAKFLTEIIVSYFF